MKFSECAVTACYAPSLFIICRNIVSYVQAASERFTTFFRKLSKRGCLPVLTYVDEKGPVHYSDILKQARASKVVESTSQINAVIHTLLDFELLDQEMITTQRPVRTLYRVTKKGKAILQLLKELENEID